MENEIAQVKSLQGRWTSFSEGSPFSKAQGVSGRNVVEALACQNWQEAIEIIVSDPSVLETLEAVQDAYRAYTVALQEWEAAYEALVYAKNPKLQATICPNGEVGSHYDAPIEGWIRVEMEGSRSIRVFVAGSAQADIEGPSFAHGSRESVPCVSLEWHQVGDPKPYLSRLKESFPEHFIKAEKVDKTNEKVLCKKRELEATEPAPENFLRASCKVTGTEHD